MSKKKKKRRRINDLLNAETKPKFFVFRLQSKDSFFYRKSFFKEEGELNVEQKKRKEDFLTAYTSAIKKDPKMSKRKDRI